MPFPPPRRDPPGPGENATGQAAVDWGPLLVLCGATLALRAWLPWSRVMGGAWVRFQDDGWYHARAIASLVANYPHRLTVDPYALIDGQHVAIAPLFDHLVALAALAIGLGHPATGTVEAVAALAPPVLAVVAVCLGYLLGRQVFGRQAGLVTAALMALMPGPFLERTQLGFTDHHVLEVVLVEATLLALCRAATDPTRAIWWWLAGCGLGAYFLSWTSAPFLLGGLAVWVLTWAWCQAPAWAEVRVLGLGLCRTGLTALTLVLAFQPRLLERWGLQVSSLVAVALLAVLLVALADQAARRRWPRATVLVLPLGLGVLGCGLIALAMPELGRHWLVDLARLRPGGAPSPILELRPLLWPGNRLSLTAPLSMFGAPFLLGIPAAAAVSWRAWRRREPDRLLLGVWLFWVLAATFKATRFGYYLAPMLALFSGAAAAGALAWWTARPSPSRWHLLGAPLALALLVAPTLPEAVATASRDSGPTPAWWQALTWLRTHSPEPFPQGDLYLARYDADAMPRAQYSVMAWWDQGYWITTLAHRVPMSNATQEGADQAAAFFTSVTPVAAHAWMDARRARYVMVDDDMAMRWTSDGADGRLRGRFLGMPALVGLTAADFAEPMYQKTGDGTLVRTWVFHPAYYQSMAVHLQSFAGRAVQPRHSSWVVSWVERTGRDGRTYKEITRLNRYATYEAAEAQLRSRGPGRHALVGLEPGESAVPLDALVRFQPVHDESSRPGGPPLVRVFAYTP